MANGTTSATLAPLELTLFFPGSSLVQRITRAFRVRQSQKGRRDWEEVVKPMRSPKPRSPMTLSDVEAKEREQLVRAHTRP